MRIVNYEENFGEIHFPEGFEETLKNLTIEEQTERYRTTEYRSYAKTAWSERTSITGYKRLEDTSEVKALIVKDGVLVGVMMLDEYGREVPCLAEEEVCTYSASDNNGAGYSTRIDYTYLVCVPEGFEQE